MRTMAGEPVPFWKKVMRWPAFLVANLALFLLIGVSTVRETYRGYTVDREIRALESQAETLEGRKMKLAELAQAASTTERIDLDVRSRLGWKKEGETVYVLAGYQPTASQDSSVFSSPPTPALSNPELWLQYFFRPTK